MSKANVTMNVRKASTNTSIVDIFGEINAFAENVLMDAYTQANSNGSRNILLNFKSLDYMNSSGIGLLVTLLIRANRTLREDVADEEAAFVLKGMRGPDGSPLPPANGLCLAVYQKQGQQWFAAAVQCMAPLMAPPGM